MVRLCRQPFIQMKKGDTSVRGWKKGQRDKRKKVIIRKRRRGQPSFLGGGNSLGVPKEGNPNARGNKEKEYKREK